VLLQAFGALQRAPGAAEEAVAAAQAAGSRVERSSGCSCRMSVADIGKRHLPWAIKVGREAHQERAG